MKSCLYKYTVFNLYGYIFVIEKLKLWKKRAGNCVALGRSIYSKDKELFNWVVDNTSFLDENVKFNERVYCLT